MFSKKIEFKFEIPKISLSTDKISWKSLIFKDEKKFLKKFQIF